jgi:hypothetical protein
MVWAIATVVLTRLNASVASFTEKTNNAISQKKPKIIKNKTMRSTHKTVTMELCVATQQRVNNKNEASNID